MTGRDDLLLVDVLVCGSCGAKLIPRAGCYTCPYCADVEVGTGLADRFVVLEILDRHHRHRVTLGEVWLEKNPDADAPTGDFTAQGLLDWWYGEPRGRQRELMNMLVGRVAVAPGRYKGLSQRLDITFL